MSLIAVKVEATDIKLKARMEKVINQVLYTPEQHERHILDLGLTEMRAKTLGRLLREVKNIAVRS